MLVFVYCFYIGGIQMNTETYNKFLSNLDDSQYKSWMQNSLINNAVQLGLRSDLTEVETLKVIILSMIKIHDEHMNNKLLAILNNPSPIIINEQMKVKLK